MASIRPYEGEVLAPGAQTSLAGVDPAIRLRAMFEGHFDFIWRSLRRLGVRSEAVDDATQEVFIVASRRLADIQPGRERAFLFGTALRVAAEDRRARARRREEDGGAVALEAEPDPSPSPEDLTEQKRARELLDHVLESMPFDLRAVFVLFELEDLTMAEIAECLELPPGTVASRLRRAREEFRTLVARIEARRAGERGVR